MLHIMVADVDAYQRRLIDILLSYDGYHLVMLENGRAVLEYLRTNTPDVAILNDKLPQIGGIDICSKIKRIRRLTHSTVVILTEESNPRRLQELRENARFVKANLVVRKPLSQGNFAEKLRELLSAQGKYQPAFHPEASKYHNSHSQAAQEAQKLHEAMNSVPMPAHSMPASARLSLESIPEQDLGNTMIIEDAISTIAKVDASTQSLGSAIKLLQAENAFLRQQNSKFKQINRENYDAAANISQLSARIQELEQHNKLLQLQNDTFRYLDHQRLDAAGEIALLRLQLERCKDISRSDFIDPSSRGSAASS